MEQPGAIAVCSKVQYRCMMQLGMDGLSCDRAVVWEPDFVRIADLARLPYKTTDKCVEF